MGCMKLYDQLSNLMNSKVCANAFQGAIKLIAAGAKRVDVEELHDSRSYRSNIKAVGGKPMFLY